MTFPLLPFTGGVRPRGALTLRGTANGAINVGDPSLDRWLVVLASLFLGDPMATWPRPTVDGNLATTLFHENSGVANEGHQGAIWLAPIPTGRSVTLSGASGNLNVFTLTGVRAPLTSFVQPSIGTTIVNPVGSCALGYWVTRWGYISGVANMIAGKGAGYEMIAYQPSMAAASVDFAPAYSGPMILQRIVSWRFDY